MVTADFTAWECDMAETYGIINFEAVPLRKLARLSAGLRETSRIKMKLSGARGSLTDYLLALLYDEFVGFKWALARAGKEDDPNNPPPEQPDRIAPYIIGTENEEQNKKPAAPEKYEAFETGADFDARWKHLTKGE